MMTVNLRLNRVGLGQIEIKVLQYVFLCLYVFIKPVEGF